MLEYRLLGPVEVLRAGQVVDLGGPKQRAVLAVLLLDAGRVVSAERLVDAVWGEDPTPSAANSLQVYVSHLRRALRDGDTGASPIARRGQGYLLDPDGDDVDLRRFDALADRVQDDVDGHRWADAVAAAHQALALWRGPLLVEYPDQEWARLAAVVVEERRLACELGLVTGLLGLGQLNAALARARELAGRHPLAERTTWLFMLALHRAGRSTEALEVYRRHARHLLDETGLDVGPELTTLHSAILRQDHAAAGWPGPDADRLHGGTTATSEPGPTPSSLVGRERELALADDVLRGAGATLRWVSLRGEAGIGKSRLAEELAARWAAAGGKVIRTGCPEDDVPPWWPVRQLLHDLDASEDVLVPPTDRDVDAARFVVYDRLLAVLRMATARDRVLVVVDDLQWADPTSVRFLIHLVEAHARLDLAVVATVRDGVRQDGEARLSAAVARLHGGRVVSLPPLSAAEVATLAARTGGVSLSEADALRLAERTGGNPFFVCEYARLPESERRDGQIPSAVRSVLDRRLEGLEPEVLAVLRVAATIGGRLDLPLLAAVARLERDDLVDLLDEAADEHIVVPAAGSGDLVFAHALLREQIVEGLSPLRRQRLHLRIAAALDPGGSTEQVVARASHLLAAMPLADATETLAACRAAAEGAETAGQWDEAATWWAMSLRPLDHLSSRPATERTELVIAQAAALARAGRGATVLTVVGQAMTEAARAGNTEAVGRLAVVPLRSSGAWPWVASGDDQDPLLDTLRAVEPAVRDDPEAHARVLSSLACGLTYEPRGEAPDRLTRQARELADRVGTPDVLADAILGRCLTFAGIAVRATESIALLDELAALDHRLADVDEVLRHSLLVMAHMTLGDVDRADHHLRLGAAGADRLRLPVARTQLRWAEATVAMWHGDLRLARRTMTQAAQLHEETELYHAGTFDAARTCLSWASGTLESATVDLPTMHEQPWAVAVTAAARATPGCDDLLAAEATRDGPPRWISHGTLTAVAHAVCDRGLVGLARPIVAKLLPYQGFIGTIGHVGVVGPVDLALARLHLLLGEVEAAERFATAAHALAARTGGEGSRLGAEVLLQRLARERGRPVDVVALRAAAGHADRLGFGTVARGAGAMIAAAST